LAVATRLKLLAVVLRSRDSAGNFVVAETLQIGAGQLELHHSTSGSLTLPYITDLM
jgi:hypothetical protein